jgi:cell wall-associated NlpC family hydrolase
MCSAWASRKVTATAVVSEGGSWSKSTEYELTANRENFSYDALVPGDVIVYYLNGEPNHVGIYLGKFETAAKLKAYLKKLGVSSAACEAYVHDWHAGTTDSDAQYWVLQGGMGSSKQVYISNSVKNLSGQVAKKIIHIMN